MLNISPVDVFERNELIMENKYAKALSIVGICILFLGILGAIVLGTSLGDSYDSFNVTAFLIGVFSSVISGVFFLGLGEIVRLLADMNEKLENHGVIFRGEEKKTNLNDTDELPDL